MFMYGRTRPAGRSATWVRHGEDSDQGSWACACVLNTCPCPCRMCLHAQSGRMRPTRPDPLEPPGGRICGAVTPKQGGQRFQPELEYRCHWRRTERPSNDGSAAPTSPPSTGTVMNWSTRGTYWNQRAPKLARKYGGGVNSGHSVLYARTRAFHLSCEITMLGQFFTYLLT